MDNQIINISVNDFNVIPRVYAVQGDKGRTITCNIVDMDIPSGATANIYALKPSGAYVQKAATISDNAVVVDLDNDILAEKGETRVQAEVINSGQNVKSFVFLLVVGESLAGDWPASSNDVTFLDDLKAEMEEATQAATSAASSANTAAAAANNAVEALKGALEGTVINDNQASNITTYSSQKINSAISEAQNTLQTQIGNLEDLDTTAKSNVVGAVNELYSKFEYGKYVPTINAGCTITNYQAEYYKVGQLVNVSVALWINKTNATSEDVRISLPFICEGYREYGVVGYFGGSANYPNLHVVATDNNAFVNIEYGTSATVDNITGQQMSTIQFSITYICRD